VPPLSTAAVPNANTLTVDIMVMVAKDEGLRISARKKAALAAAEVRGTKLGGNRGVEPTMKVRPPALRIGAGG
jgi:hypothetical protein